MPQVLHDQKNHSCDLVVADILAIELGKFNSVILLRIAEKYLAAHV